MNATKPFCLEHAKAGAPIVSSDGTPLRFIAHEPEALKHASLVVLAAERVIRVLSDDGSYMLGQQSLFDAVMAPLGYIDGKPVFVGDRIIYHSGIEDIVEPHERDFNDCRWPEPENTYPVTGMHHRDVAQFLGREEHWHAATVVKVANAALRHAIDVGQVVAKEDHEAELVRLGEQLRGVAIGRNPARDMAIAEAVRAAVKRIPVLRLDYRLATLDLAAIIATVPE